MIQVVSQMPEIVQQMEEDVVAIQVNEAQQDESNVPSAQYMVGLPTIAAAYRVLRQSNTRFPLSDNDMAILGYVFEDWSRAILLVQYYWSRRTNSIGFKYKFRQDRVPPLPKPLYMCDNDTKEKGKPEAELQELPEGYEELTADQSIETSTKARKPVTQPGIDESKRREVTSFQREIDTLQVQLKNEKTPAVQQQLELMILEKHAAMVDIASSQSAPSYPMLTPEDIAFLEEFLKSVRGPKVEVEVEPLSGQALPDTNAANNIFASDNMEALALDEDGGEDGNNLESENLVIMTDDSENACAAAEAERKRNDYTRITAQAWHGSGYRYMGIEAATTYLELESFKNVPISPMRPELTYRTHQILGECSKP